jgi:RNA polymerase sigma-70 factor (ECF subfamily)
MTDAARWISGALDRTCPAAVEEAALVSELQAGSEEAFAYLLAVYANPIFNLVFHILADGSDAADVVQEVFVKVFRGIKQFHGESSLRTWIYRIAVHEASNHRRGWWRRRVHEPVSLDDTAGESGPTWGETRAGEAETPYEMVEHAERQKIVRRALAGLPQPYRTVVVLRELEGLSYEEIAQVLGIAEGTVKSRLMRGRELLRRKLAACLGY